MDNKTFKLFISGVILFLMAIILWVVYERNCQNHHQQKNIEIQHKSIEINIPEKKQDNWRPPHHHHHPRPHIEIHIPRKKDR